jgi:hypothetical protein
MPRLNVKGHSDFVEDDIYPKFVTSHEEPFILVLTYLRKLPLKTLSYIHAQANVSHFRSNLSVEVNFNANKMQLE